MHHTTMYQDSLLFLTKQHRFFLMTAGLVAAVSFFDFLASWHLAELIGVSLSPDSSGTLANWQVLLVFFASYLSRPLGAYFIGRYGDKYGRKSALSLNFLMLAIFTLVLAFLPTYHHLQIVGLGNLAFAFFVIAKFGQGMAFGAQFPILWTYSTEKLPISNIGFGAGLICACTMIGGLCFFLYVSFIENTLNQTQLTQYGWRLPFLLSGLFGLALLYPIKKLNESPVFLHNQAHINPTQKAIFFHKKRWKKSLIVIGLSWFIASTVMIMVFLLESLLLFSFSDYGSLLRIGSLVSLFFLIVGCIFFGFLSDRSNGSKIIVIGSFLFLFSFFGLFYDLETGGRFLLLSFSLSGFFAGVIGAMPATMIRLIPMQYRLSNVCLIYNSVYAIIGMFLPIVLGYATFYAKYSPVVYLSFVCAVTLSMSFYLYYYPKNQDEIYRFD